MGTGAGFFAGAFFATGSVRWKREEGERERVRKKNKKVSSSFVLRLFCLYPTLSDTFLLLAASLGAGAGFETVSFVASGSVRWERGGGERVRKRKRKVSFECSLSLSLSLSVLSPTLPHSSQRAWERVWGPEPSLQELSWPEGPPSSTQEQRGQRRERRRLERRRASSSTRARAGRRASRRLSEPASYSRRQQPSGLPLWELAWPLPVRSCGRARGRPGGRSARGKERHR